MVLLLKIDFSQYVFSNCANPVQLHMVISPLPFNIFIHSKKHSLQRQKSYALKRSMKLSVCKVCYEIIDIDGFDDVIKMNIDGKLQEVTRIRKL